jgi:hypothetical protein
VQLLVLEDRVVEGVREEEVDCWTNIYGRIQRRE